MARVLIVEDSPVMQRLLADIIRRGEGLEVAGIAADPYEARELVKSLKPDVMTLDVELPRMDGLTFLERLMRLHPMPVVMVSSQTERDAEASLRALELGAVDVIAKPRAADGHALIDFAAEIAERLRAAARADVGAREAAGRPARPGVLEGPADARALEGKLVAIGASTGGTEAIREVLARLPARTPPVAIVQHMPEMFTRMFAKRLGEQCELEVREAVDGEPLKAGHAYVAPGNWHLSVKRVGKGFEARVAQGEAVNRHRPSVDVLFDSVAAAAGAAATAVILTGMGSDGAAGMRRIRAAGGHTLAQEEASCVVFGMPKSAIEAGAVERVLPLGAIAERIVARARENAPP
ncbi:MAG: chemotaxis response regulator protein-glutamate methylesterase [Betaproteobacteria bacterium]|nr:chemotaxis response regulator protein-glutamate methylesterase [Betaproteobacteria bacterium]